MRQGFAAGLLAEFGRLRLVVTRRWREHGAAGFAPDLAVVTRHRFVWVLDHTRAHHVVTACCGERVGAPITAALLRLPGSLVAPAALLPVWGSLIQVVLAFGLAEAAVGALRTDRRGNVPGSGDAGRPLLRLVRTRRAGGLPTSWRTAIDTGPSAATVGLAVYLAIVLGCPRIGAVVILAIAITFAARSDLAGREHLVAIIVGAACAAVQLLAYRWSARTRPRNCDPATWSRGRAFAASAIGFPRPRFGDSRCDAPRSRSAKRHPGAGHPWRCAMQWWAGWSLSSS